MQHLMKRVGKICVNAAPKMLLAHENPKHAFMAVQVGWGM